MSYRNSQIPPVNSQIKPLHIAKYIPPPYGGVEGHVDTLLRSLLPDIQGSLVAGECPVVGHFMQDQFPYRVLAAKSFGKFASATISPGVFSSAINELDSGRSNLLHIHPPNPWGDFVALACPKSIPVVMTWHSDIVRQRNLMKVYRVVQRQALKRVDKIIVFTPKHYESSEQLHQLDVESKIVFIPIGIDFERLDVKYANANTFLRIKGFSKGRPTILTVGRHVYYKGYEFLISAISRLRSNAVLVMVGSGVLTDVLMKLARRLNIEDRVLFLGEVDNPSLVSAFHSCDIFCLPSITPNEAFGIASAEAMACGKPTIVCELNNGVNYLNRKGETSLAVPPRDVGALANAIDELVVNDELRIQMGGAANNWVRSEFSVAAMKRGILELYKSLF